MGRPLVPMLWLQAEDKAKEPEVQGEAESKKCFERKAIAEETSHYFDSQAIDASHGKKSA